MLLFSHEHNGYTQPDESQPCRVKYFLFRNPCVFALTGHNSKLILTGQIEKKVARGCKSTQQ